MIWSDLRGHAAQVAMFRRAVQRGRVAHAYLFVGPAGVGKRLVARRMAQSLFCTKHPPEDLDACGVCSACKQVQAEVHPDLLSIGLPAGKKELPISLLVGEGERRGREGLLKQLSLRPMSAPRRIAIIDDADRMNDESANALLKTLEEPPPGSILFLISSSSDALLPTIRSRCQPLHFGGLSETDVASLLVALDWTKDPAEAVAIAGLSEGSLDMARQLLEGGLQGLRDALHEALSQRPFSPLEASQQLLQVIEEQGGGTSGQREQAGWLVRFAVDFLRQALAPGDAVTDALARFRLAYPPHDPVVADRLTRVLERCLLAEEQLLQSMPVPLCLESLWHDVGRVLRGTWIP